MKIIFMGTSNFALQPLQKIIESKRHEIICLYTKAPKLGGRGKNKLIISPTEIVANENNIPVYTPVNFKSDDEINKIRNMKPDIIVVVSYGIILPKNLLAIPKYGAINLHPSSLPYHRGAAPIERSIASGSYDSSICIIDMDEFCDTGDILYQKSVKISDSDTYSELINIFSGIGAEMLVEVLDNYNNFVKTKQLEKEDIIYAKKISNEERLIDFDNDVRLVARKIHALSFEPGAYFIYNNEKIKILKTNFEYKTIDRNNIGIIMQNGDIPCGNGILKPILVQKEGKKMMDYKSFLNGIKK